MEEDAKMTWEIWFESTKHENLQQSCKVPTIWVVSHMDIFLPPSYVEVYITRLRCNGGAAEHNINNNKNDSHMHHKAYRQKIELIFSWSSSDPCSIQWTTVNQFGYRIGIFRILNFIHIWLIRLDVAEIWTIYHSSNSTSLSNYAMFSCKPWSRSCELQEHFVTSFWCIWLPEKDTIKKEMAEARIMAWRIVDALDVPLFPHWPCISFFFSVLLFPVCWYITCMTTCVIPNNWP